MESSYGPDTYPSDWSEVIHQQKGELRGNACYTAALHLYMGQRLVFWGREDWRFLKMNDLTSYFRDQFESICFVFQTPYVIGLVFTFISINSNNDNKYYL